jgi:hypothetical protein
MRKYVPISQFNPAGGYGLCGKWNSVARDPAERTARHSQSLEPWIIKEPLSPDIGKENLFLGQQKYNTRLLFKGITSDEDMP